MATTSPVSAALERDLALLERFTAAGDLAGQAVAVGLAALCAFCLFALVRLAVRPLPTNTRAALALAGAGFGALLLSIAVASWLHDNKAPATVAKAELCERLFAQLAAQDAGEQVIDRVLGACPDHTTALRAILTARAH